MLTMVFKVERVRFMLGSAFDAIMSKKKQLPPPSSSSSSHKKKIKLQNRNNHLKTPPLTLQQLPQETTIADRELKEQLSRLNMKRKPLNYSNSLSCPCSAVSSWEKGTFRFLSYSGAKADVAVQPPPLPQETTTAELKERVSWLSKKPSQFNPCSVSWWEKGEPVPFLFLSMVLDMIDKETGRIAITDILCNLLRTVIHTTPEDLVFVVYLSAGRIAPPHQGLELGIGDASIIKALAEACGSTQSHIKKQFKDEGDLGLVAKASRLSQSMLRKPDDALTIRKVFNTFHLIAEESGKGGQEKKKNHIKSLLLAATDCEPLYLVRLLQTKLRIGCAEQTLLAALGQAAVYTEEHSKPPPEIQSPLAEAAKIVKQVYSVLPDYDKIVSALLTDGVWLLPKTCNFTPGVPVGPMLSKAITGVSKALKKFQDVEFTCEYKYDGERAQMHYMENGSVEIYSRNAERNTVKFPDVVDAVSRLRRTSVSSFVLDCELVAYDRAKHKLLPFQVLSTRARKNVAVRDMKVDVCIFAFDLLYLNGRALLQENLKIRREHLYASFEEESGLLQFATSITSNDAEEIQNFLDEAVDACCEGLIMKTLNEDATYAPSERSLNWLKLKKDYLKNMGDTLDLVPVGAFYGKGKRSGVYGAFLLACYDTNNEEFQTICKTGTGFSEEMLEECFARLRSIPKAEAYYRHAAKIEPDVWFEASEVWEVRASDLTISSTYQAAVGIVDSKKGISLRMPRLVRVRPDKTPKQATSSEQVAEMYNAQKNTITRTFSERQATSNIEDNNSFADPDDIVPSTTGLMDLFKWYVEKWETVPYTNRTRFIFPTKAEERQLGEKSFEKLVAAYYKGKILPPTHRKSVRVNVITKNIVDALQRELKKMENNTSSSVQEHTMLYHVWKCLLRRPSPPSISHLDGLNWEVWVVKDPAVFAYCLPGGKIFLGISVLKDFKSDAEIATVIGHEVAHIVARHGADKITRVNRIFYLLGILGLRKNETFDWSELEVPSFYRQLPFNRRYELEADYIGLLLLASAGYDPQVAPKVYEKMGNSEEFGGISFLEDYFSSHPSGIKRAKALARAKIMEEALTKYNDVRAEAQILLVLGSFLCS